MKQININIRGQLVSQTHRGTVPGESKSRPLDSTPGVGHLRSVSVVVTQVMASHC